MQPSNLTSHYESYKESLKKDFLDGAISYGRTLPTARPDVYPTVLTYLKAASEGAKDAIVRGDVEAYKAWMSGHQQAMLGLLKRYVETTGLRGLDLIEKRGWRWWRFSDEELLCHGVEMFWVPRGKHECSSKCKHPAGIPLFDAEELEYIFQLKDEAFTQTLLKEKQQRTVKFLPRTGELIDPRNINADRVNDWTSPLFVEETLQ